jgi:hypothetical protein
VYVIELPAYLPINCLPANLPNVKEIKKDFLVI